MVNLNDYKGSPFSCILKDLKQTDIIKKALAFLDKRYNFIKHPCKKIEQSFPKMIIELAETTKDIYKIQFWGQSEEGKEVSYSDNSMITIDKLSEKIEANLKLTAFLYCGHLEFILPKKLLQLDLKELKGEREYFLNLNLTIKIRERKENKELRAKRYWEDNWQLYIDDQEKTVKQMSFEFDENDNTDKINKDTIEKYPLMIMHCPLSDEIFDVVHKNGISIILYFQNKYKQKQSWFPWIPKSRYDEVFKSTKMNNLIAEVHNNIRNNYRNKKTKDQSHIALIWDNPTTTPKSLKERDTL